MQRLADTILLQYYNHNKKVFAFFSANNKEDTEYICAEVEDRLANTLKVRHLDADELIKIRGAKENVSEELYRKLDENEVIIINSGGIFTNEMPLTQFKYFDAGILVIKAGVTRKAMIQEAMSWLKLYDIELIGTVLCDVKRVIPNFIYRMVF